MQLLSILFFFISCIIRIGYGSERVTETWKNTTEGINFKIRKSLFTKISNKKFKINQNINIIQQSYQTTPTNCGKACQDIDPCLGFLFRRNKQPLTCIFVDHSVNLRDMEETEDADYYEIQSKCTENEGLCNKGKCIPFLQNNTYTCQCPTNYLGQNCEEFKLIRNNLYDTIPLWPKERFVSLSIKPKNADISWASVFHFTVGRDEERYPMLLIDRDEWYLIAHANGMPYTEIYTEQPISQNVFSHFYYEQRFNSTLGTHVIKLFINNILIREVLNNDAKDYHDVKVYLSSPWTDALDGTVKDFQYGIL